MAGLPARLAFLASDAPPERHTVTEVYLWGRWAVVDGFSGRLYIWPKHGYASAWDIHLLPQIVDQHPDHGRQPYVESRFYRHVGIASYDLADTAAYDYTDEPTPADLVERLARGLGA